ncbi:MAG: peptidylprolyl isomerase [Kiloniellales bacterium]|nr:peptidylprolyl isomerase [Kiloniellales bacterium]
MTQLSLRAASLAAAFALAAPAAAAQEPAAEDPVVATVNGDDVLRSEVLETAEQLPPQYRQQIDLIFPQLLQRTIDIRLIAAAAEAGGMGDDPEVKRRLEEIRRAVMREVYVEKQVAERISEDMLKERYDAFVEANPPKPEVHARHILVEEETDARDLIGKLDEGADFAELAKEHSIGPSGAQGGDLDYFTKEQMVPAFADAAFALDKGSYSKDPVQTEFGWHVIEVLDRRELPSPSMEEVEDQLFEELSQEAVQDILTELRDGAEIKIVEADEPAPEPADEPEASPAPSQ